MTKHVDLPIYIFHTKDIIGALRCELVARGYTDIPPADKCGIQILPGKTGRVLSIALTQKLEVL